MTVTRLSLCYNLYFGTQVLCLWLIFLAMKCARTSYMGFENEIQ